MVISSQVIDRNPGNILKKAKKEDVIITNHSKPIVVIISYEQYLKLKKSEKIACS